MKASGWVAALLVLSAACAAEEIVVATADPPPDGGRVPDGGRHPPPPHPCSTNSECHVDEFCAKPNCQEALGTCARRPVLCGVVPDPFCGCDGITYFNDCLRRAGGIEAATPGECNAGAVTCGGPGHVACPPRSFCATLLPTGPVPKCPADAPGACWVLPGDCGPPAPGDRWMPCGPPAACVDSCNAMKSGVPHWRAPGCP